MTTELQSVRSDPAALAETPFNVIRGHDGDTFDLANGCMCCSLVGGFTAAIDAARQRAADFADAVIEASGVADPGRIAQYGRMFELPLDGIGSSPTRSGSGRKLSTSASATPSCASLRRPT